MVNAINPRQLEGLAGIIFSLWKFFTTNLNLNQNFYDVVNKKEKTAVEMFCVSNNMILINRDCLPLDPNIKAAFVNAGRGKSRGRIYIETTMLDFGKISEGLNSSPLRYQRLGVKGRCFLLDGKPFIQTRSQQHFPKVFSPRTVMWPLMPLTEELIGHYLEVSDLIYGSDCFNDSAKPQITFSVDAAQPIEMKQVMEQKMQQQLQQLLSTEQRPLMSMNQYMMARLYEKQRVLSLSGPELLKFVREKLKTNPALSTS